MRFCLFSCHFRPDRRGRIQRITAGLGFFGHPNAVPPDPPCGKVGRRDRRGWQLFHVLQPSQDDLGSLYTPAVLCSRRMVQQLPSQTAYLLVQASQPLWLANIHDACERSFRFNLVTRL